MKSGFHQWVARCPTQHTDTEVETPVRQLSGDALFMEARRTDDLVLGEARL